MAVKVFVRFRPQTEKEAQSGGQLAVKRITDKTFSVSDEKGEDSRFTFDGVFYDDATQDDIYATVAKPVVEDVLAFGNGSVICYGQTGAGKTHTMEGDGLSGTSPTVGIVPRVAEAIFSGLTRTEQTSTIIKLSVIEVYLERIRDLFDPSKDHLPLKDDPVEGAIVSGATEVKVTGFAEVLRLMKGALENRAVGETGMNNSSSRSHCVYTMTVEEVDEATGGVRTGRLHLVDLAGSEKVDKTGASGMTLNEAKAINKSLSALGNVIYALTKGSCTHVPFRDSKLTRILQSSLAGRSQTSLVCCCSPSTVNASETLSTIRFGVRAKEIREPPAPAPPAKNDYKALYKNMQQDFEALKSQCRQLEDVVARLTGSHPDMSLDAPLLCGPQGSSGNVESNMAVQDLHRVKLILTEVCGGANKAGITEATSIEEIEAILVDELYETLSAHGGIDGLPENVVASDDMRELCEEIVAENIALMKALALCSTKVH